MKMPPSNIYDHRLMRSVACASLVIIGDNSLIWKHTWCNSMLRMHVWANSLISPPPSNLCFKTILFYASYRYTSSVEAPLPHTHTPFFLYVTECTLWAGSLQSDSLVFLSTGTFLLYLWVSFLNFRPDYWLQFIYTSYHQTPYLPMLFHPNSVISELNVFCIRSWGRPRFLCYCLAENRECLVKRAHLARGVTKPLWSVVTKWCLHGRSY